MRRALGILVAAFGLSASAQVRETIEVAVTSVDVVVTDAKGRRVRGLRREDFQILENGQPREITNFSEYALAAPGASAPAGTVSSRVSAPQVVPPRRLLIVFDGNTLTPELRRRSAAAARSFVALHVRPVDQVMVAVLDRSFTPRTEWTSDRAQLHRAIDQLADERTAIGADLQRKQAEKEITDWIDAASSTVGVAADVLPPSFEELIRTAHRYAEEALQESRRIMAVLDVVVRQLSSVREKKALIFIGEGLDARPGAEMFERLEALRSAGNPSLGLQAMLSRGAPPSPLVSEALRYSNAADLRALAETAFRKGVPIFAINPGTNTDTGTGERDLGHHSQEFTRFASRAEGFETVGNGSGGGAYIGMSAEVALGEVAADLGGYYSLGFRSSGVPGRDAIQVRLKQPAHRARMALAGATPASTTEAMTDAVTAHHVLEPGSNDLEIEIATSAPVLDGGKQMFTLHVIIPIRNLQLSPEGSHLTGGFDVYFSISDGESYFSEVKQQSYAVRWPPGSVAEDDERKLTYSIEVTVEGLANGVSVGVVDHRSKKTGYARIQAAG